MTSRTPGHPLVRRARIPVAVALASAAAAHAEPAVVALSASRATPTLEWAFGPRSQLSIGDRLELARSLRLDALAAFENADGWSPLASQAGRLRIQAGYTQRLAAGLALELGAGIERARELRAAERSPLLPEPRQRDIPFGGGGEWIAIAVATCFELSPHLALGLRAGDRVFLGALPLLVGSRAASDIIADGLGEGLAHAPFVDAVLTLSRWHGVTPFVAWFGELLVPQDRIAALSGRARMITGAAWPTVAPFLSLDVGSGEGILINRHELRLSIGARRVF